MRKKKKRLGKKLFEKGAGRCRGEEGMKWDLSMQEDKDLEDWGRREKELKMKNYEV